MPIDGAGPGSTSGCWWPCSSLRPVWSGSPSFPNEQTAAAIAVMSAFVYTFGALCMIVFLAFRHDRRPVGGRAVCRRRGCSGRVRRSASVGGIAVHRAHAGVVRGVRAARGRRRARAGPVASWAGWVGVWAGGRLHSSDSWRPGSQDRSTPVHGPPLHRPARRRPPGHLTPVGAARRQPRRQHPRPPSARRPCDRRGAWRWRGPARFRPAGGAHTSSASEPRSNATSASSDVRPGPSSSTSTTTSSPSCRTRTSTDPPSGAMRRAFSTSPSSSCRSRMGSVRTVARCDRTLEADVGTLEGRPPHGAEVVQHGGDVDLGLLEVEVVGLEPREGEQVRHEAVDALGLGDEHLAGGTDVLGSDRSLGKGLRVSAQGGERRADLVGHREQELALASLAGGERLVERRDRVPHVGDLADRRPPTGTPRLPPRDDGPPRPSRRPTG